MDLQTYFQNLYNYHYWANRHSLAAASGLTREQLHQPQGHSWGSVYDVLVHMFNAEWIWLRRWQGESPTAFPSLAEFPTLETLQARWQAQEQELFAFLHAQDEAALQREVAYQTTRGIPYHEPLWQLLAHVANHATHHRGELAAMFAQLGAPHEEDDLVFYFRRK